MPRILLIYNLYSVPRWRKYRLKKLVHLAKQKGFKVNSLPLSRGPEIRNDVRNHEVLLIAGGDGTVNLIVEKLLQENLKNPPPLAIIPWGTSNDLAAQLNRGQHTIANILHSIQQNKIQWLDVGRVNKGYFVNVVAGGMFANIAYLTGNTAKRWLGRAAYYLYGLSKIYSYRSFPLHIQAPGIHLEERIRLFLVLNGQRAGGIFQPAPDAALNDGQLHLVALKKEVKPSQLAPTLFRMLRGCRSPQPGILYLTAHQFYLDFPYHMYKPVVDGEEGPPPPLQLDVLPSHLPLIEISGKAP